jgi:hypothetical protein
MGITASVLSALTRRASGSLARAAINIGDDDLGALLCKALGRGSPDAATAPSYQGNFTHKPPHDGLLRKAERPRRG